MGVEFEPMRSLIYVDVCKEKYRHKLQYWLHYYHVPESISTFGPYVTKYAFYPTLPTPSDGELYGPARMQLTEHYWLVNPMQPAFNVRTYSEYFPKDVLVWQGTIPEDSTEERFDGDDARSSGGDNGCPPFVMAFVPMCWETELKGKGRTIVEGPNYRFQFVVKFPEGITNEVGDEWLMNDVLPEFVKMDEVKRIITSKIIQEVSHCPFYRVVEMWFDGPEEWHEAMVEKAKDIKAPVWAKDGDVFPFLKSRFEIASLFLTDITAFDNMTSHRGYITMR